jgi:4-cresol dehydrogenase (hydroxylating) flavoprotein subunit
MLAMPIEERRVALLRRWTQLLGDAVVGTAPEEVSRDVGEFRRRRVAALLRPRAQAQVRAVLAAATEFGGAVPIYPISTGRNWGLGSRQPAADDCALLDLGGLNSVRRLSLEHGYAVIEPGVTQGELSRLLEGTPFMLNVTSSSANTSVLGNALERGVGFTRQRTEDLLALEVVLASGAQIRVGGFWDAPGPPSREFFYRHGIGPDLLPLFSQSNLGIVTAGVVALLPRPECVRIFLATFPEPVLGRALDLLRKLHHQGLLNSTSRVYNAESIPTCRAEDGFLFAGAFRGRRGVADAVTEAIFEEFRQADVSPNVQAFDAESADRVPGAGRSLANAFAGRPGTGTNIQHTFGTPECDADHAAAEGYLQFLPVVPFEPTALRRAFDLSEAIAREEGVRRDITFNVLGPSCVDLVTSIRFPRTPDGIRRGHAALDRLHIAFRREGFFPYRADIDHQAADDLYGSGTYQATLRELKRALDPAGIISPGRYLPCDRA